MERPYQILKTVMPAGGLTGGEWNSSVAEAAFKTERVGMAMTGKIAVTPIGLAGPEFSTLFTYG
jgi:hypothetical protein